MKADPPGAHTELLAAVERAVYDATPSTLPYLLGELERLKTLLWQRLLATSTAQKTLIAAHPLDDLRHLTPQQVGDLLNLKPAYVHELCRTGRLKATKSGKYWMIPVTGLRQWLSQNPDVDGDTRARLESLNLPGDTAPGPRATPARGVRQHQTIP